MDFQLIETFGYWPGDAAAARHWPLHRQRLLDSARALGWALPATAMAAIDTLVGALAHQCSKPARCRLTLDRRGRSTLERSEMPPAVRQWKLALADDTLDADDPMLRHKTTARAVYDRARATMPEGVDEVLLLNQRGELCEGSVSNLFLQIGNQWCTPALSSGLLPGVLRARLLATGQIEERVLYREDLATASAICVGNSLRGLIPCELLVGTG